MFDAPHSPVLCDMLKHATNTPDKIALVEGNERVSYSDLMTRIQSVACYLQSLGLHPGDRILLSAQKELEFVYLYFAAHLSGIVNVVVDAASPRERLDYIMDIVRPKVVFGNNLAVEHPRCVSFGDIQFCECDELSVPHGLKPTDVADVMFTTGTTGAPKGVCLSHANIAGSASNTNGFIGTRSDDVEALALPLSHSDC